MTIMNEGEIIINDKTRAGEVAQIFVAAGIYDSVEKVPVTKTMEQRRRKQESASMKYLEILNRLCRRLPTSARKQASSLMDRSATPVTMMADITSRTTRWRI